MSSFVLRRDYKGMVRMHHRDTDKQFMSWQCEPYYDLWPISKRVTRWVVCWHIFGIRFAHVRWRLWVPYWWWER